MCSLVMVPCNISKPQIVFFSIRVDLVMVHIHNDKEITKFGGMAMPHNLEYRYAKDDL